MSKIQELLNGRDQVIDYDTVIRKFPWIIEENKKCIISPDSDGLLCGLFMSKYLGWEVIGFYDSKVMLLRNGHSVYGNDTVFLDMEIYRRDIKSVGHHMLLMNNRRVPPNWNNLDQCLNPNNLRNYDGKNLFRLKYPLATIHLLIGIIGHTRKIDIPISTIAPLFFTDGTFMVLYAYPENVLHWLKYLGIEREESPLRNIFMHQHFTVYEQILAMNDFFRKRDEISITGERGDRFIISKGRNFVNIEPDGLNYFKITDEKKNRVNRFINLLSETTGWEYKESSWCFSQLDRYRLTKNTFKDNGWTMSNRDYLQFMELNPLSWAMTSNTNIEYTLEEPDTLL